MLAAPHRQVVEGLLGPDGHAVETQQEGLWRRIYFVPDERVVERGEKRLAGSGKRDDRLHRGVVLGPCVQEFPRARKEPRRRKLFGWLLPPPFHRPCVARARVLAPASTDAPLSATQQDADGRETPHGNTPHGSEPVIVVGIAVDGREAQVALTQDALTEEFVH